MEYTDWFSTPACICEWITRSPAQGQYEQCVRVEISMASVDDLSLS